ncbi:MAG: transpeptidase family protein [Spirochaetaceae bacterium]|jgi:cell division protein FtsI (penicillin-binding protein 3)|nr:transpeptidase family protein [Spirochaetaceae bacterium]
MIDSESGSYRKSLPNRRRFLVFIVLFTVAALTVLVRYGMLMFNPSVINVSETVRTLAERGSILDRNGRILALQTRLGNVSVWRPEITDIEETSRALAPILGIPAGEIRDRITSSAGDFLYLRKQVDQSTIREIEKLRAGGSIRGIGIESVPGRIYPEKQLASQIIGFVGDENTGLGGIEYAFNRDLAPAITEQGEIRNGSQVILTIDANVQFILEDIASRTLTENRAEGVMLLAMDPRTGDILGSASIPNFDPNNIRTSDAESRMDRPAMMAYEPGSVFKVFSIAALLDSGAIQENSVFVCDGHYERITGRGERITINCLSAHGRVTAREIIIYSCNAGAAYASDRLGPDAFSSFLREFGFGARTGMGSPGETTGFLRSVERWSERSKPTIAMGQEIAVSAMQMIQAATAIANDGVLVPPRIVSRIVSADGRTTRDYNPGPPRRIIKGETARTLRSYMVDVTSGIGTGWRANVEDLSLAVKTGTAQIINSQTGAYSDTDFIASCIALLPAESPSLVLYLVISKPQGSSYLGGRIAAPPVREAAEALVDYLGIPRGRNPQVGHSGSISLPTRNLPNFDKQVPNLLGFSKRQLIPLLLRDDLHIEINGDGWVRRQSPEPGTALEGDTVIRLELE